MKSLLVLCRSRLSFGTFAPQEEVWWSPNKQVEELEEVEVEAEAF